MDKRKSFIQKVEVILISLFKELNNSKKLVEISIDILLLRVKYIDLRIECFINNFKKMISLELMVFYLKNVSSLELHINKLMFSKSMQKQFKIFY